MLKKISNKNSFLNSCLALEHFSGEGSVPLLKYDSKCHFILIEKIKPGKTIEHLEDLTAVKIVINLIGKLHKKTHTKKASQLPSIYNWGQGFSCNEKIISQIGTRLHSYGKGIFFELIENSDSWILLHGDLHHFNILSSKEENWTSIDPKGVLGPKEYEMGCFIRNPYPNIARSFQLKKTILNRISMLSEIGKFDSKLIKLWSFSQAILASIWAIQDGHKNWRGFLDIAKSHNNSFT